MLTALLESRPRAVHPPTRRRAGIVLSVVAHGAVVALAVASAGRAESSPPPPARADTTLVFHAPREPAAADARRGASTRAVDPRRPTPGPQLALRDAAPAVDVALPDVALPTTGDAPTPDTFGGARLSAGTDGSGAGGMSDGLGDAPRDARTVERPAAPLPGTRAPRYPEALRAAGVEGSAVLRFVVDTTGRVEAGSVDVVRADHPLFAESARLAVAAARYRPAEVAGRRVRQLVAQAFAFALAR